MLVASPHPWVDVSRYPIVILEFPPHSAPSDLRSFTVALLRFAAELKDPIAIVSDLSQVRSTDPEIRQVYAEFVRDVRALAGSRVRGAAVITRSPFQRTMLNLHALLVGKIPYPLHAFETRAEAIQWLLARLETVRK